MPSRRRREEHEGRLPQPGVPAGPRNTASIEPPRQSGATTLYPEGSDGDMRGTILPPGVTENTGDPATDIISSDPNATAAALLTERERKSSILSTLLNAVIPTIGDPGDSKADALKALKEANKKYDKSLTPIMGGLTPEEQAIVPLARKAHRKYPDVPASVLMALTRQESGFDPNAVSSAGAEGLTQFMPGTAPGYKVKYGSGPKEKQSQLTGAADLLSSSGFAEDPYAALETYTGGSPGHGYSDAEYNDPVLRGAADYTSIDKGKPNPRAAKALKSAKQEALAAGVPQRQIGDIVNGNDGPDDQGQQTVKVRADAKGMVDWAEHLKGTQEGTPKQQKWADLYGLGYEEPWCANFISNGLSRRGVKPPPNPNYVPSYENEWEDGKSIGTDISQAKPGDLITYSGQHIALYLGGGKAISGNSGDEVAVTGADEGPAPISAILRPGYQGGTVRMPVTATNSTWGGESSGSRVAGTSSMVGGVADSNPILNAALNKTNTDTSQKRGLTGILGFLNSPVPEIGAPLEPLSTDDELFKLATRRRA